MANIDLFTSVTSGYPGIEYQDADDAIRWVKDYFFEVYAGELLPFFKSGMPMKFPDGKFGYSFIGTGYIHSDPIAKPNDHRISYRFANPKEYRCDFKGYHKLEIPLTIYKEELKEKLQNPSVYMQKLLSVTARVYPNYLKFLTHEILKGDGMEGDPILKNWVENTLKLKKNNSNYVFFQSEGVGAINLSEAVGDGIKKVTQLDDQGIFKDLKAINDMLKKDERKITVNYTEDKALSLSEKKAGYKTILEKPWAKKNITGPHADKAKKFYALCLAIKEALTQIKINKVFLSTDFKVKKETFEGALTPCTLQDVTLAISMSDVETWELSTQMSELGVKIESPLKWLEGVRILPSSSIASGTAYLFQNDLVQCWFPSELARSGFSEFERDGTLDYWHKFGHTLNIVDLFGCAYFKAE